MPETRIRRLFFALQPDRVVREQIMAATAKHIPAGARPVSLENLHMTLAFLGGVNAETHACVEQAAGRIHAGSFHITLEQISHWRRPQILWLGPLQVPEALTGLERALEAGLAACGFQAEERSYRPHVTLARKVGGQLPPRHSQPIDWPVNSFCLMESDTRPEGVCYSVLHRWPLDPA